MIGSRKGYIRKGCKILFPGESEKWYMKEGIIKYGKKEKASDRN